MLFVSTHQHTIPYLKNSGNNKTNQNMHMILKYIIGQISYDSKPKTNRLFESFFVEDLRDFLWQTPAISANSQKLRVLTASVFFPHGNVMGSLGAMITQCGVGPCCDQNS